LGLQGGQVRIGIEAPKNVAVHRNEIFERIQAEQVLAAIDVKGLPIIFHKKKKIPNMISLAGRRDEKVVNGNS